MRRTVDAAMFATALRSYGGRILTTLTAGVRRLAFWTAVAFPLAYVPVLATTGRESVVTMAVLGLLFGHGFSLFVGYRYGLPE
jgi:hypothetical protein